MRRLAALVVLVACPALAGKEPLTLERIFADPPVDGSVPRQLAWFADSEHFAYLECSGIEDETCEALVIEAAAPEGRREVFTVKDFRPGELACTKGAPQLFDYLVSPVGDSVALRGDGELYLASLSLKRVRRIAAIADDDTDVAFSPDGKWLAYRRDHDLFAYELGTGREVKVSRDGGPTRLNGVYDWVYREEVVEADTPAFVWSPDSTTIAFITLDETGVPEHPITDELPAHPTTRQQRYPNPGDPNPVAGLALVRVASPGDVLARKEIAWTGPSAPYLARFGFTPDSRRVAFELLDRPQRHLELGFVGLGDEPLTTSLMDEDVAWVNLHDDLHILADGRMLWSSERDGFRHLYLYPAGAGAPRQLTRGAWEVTGVAAVDERAGVVTFTATEKSPLERHLYRVRLDGSGLERLTREDGTHDVLAAPNGAFFLDTYSRSNRPKSVRLLDRDGKVLRVVAGNENPPLAGLTAGISELVTFKGLSKHTLYGQLTKPDDFDPARKYPVVVYVYGGPGMQLARDVWGGRNALFARYLASRGVLVLSVDNRGSSGRGRQFERALLGRLGKVELEDQLAGVAWLAKQPFVDASRIGIWGWSYGGFMTCYAMTHAADVFKVGAAVAPVTDWLLYDSIYTERYLKLPADNPEGYKASSPVHDARKLAGPLLLAHGTGDDNVHSQNTFVLVDELYKAGKPYDLQLYPNKSHSIKGQQARTHLYRHIADHLVGHLVKGSPAAR